MQHVKGHMNSPLVQRKTSSIELMNIIIKDSELLQVFLKYTKQNHAEENLLFYLDVERYREIEDTSQRILCANEIFNQYIEIGAKSQLGMISQEDRDILRRCCAYPPSKMFNSVQRRALMELAGSILPDFSQSPEFKGYFKASGYSEVETLLEILNDPYESVIFERYLQSVGAVDCLKFIKANEYYLSLKDKEAKLQQAFYIFTVFLDIESISPIELTRVPKSLRQEIQTRIELESVDDTLFSNVADIMMDEATIYVCGYFKSPSAEIYANSKKMLVHPGSIIKEPTTETFSPFFLHPVEFKNRIGTRVSDPHRSAFGEPHDWLLVSVGNLAMSGVGYICIESVAVEPNGRTCPSAHGLWSADHTQIFSRASELAKETKAVLGIQLTHAGRKAALHPPKSVYTPQGNARYVASKSKKIDKVISCTNTRYSQLYEIPTAISKKEIAEIVRSYIEAAKRAVSLGYQVIEIQGGRGHLIHQFLSPQVNQRTDSYGGSFDGRTRFLMEIVRGIKKVIPPSAILICELSCGDPAPGTPWSYEDCVTLASKLKDNGVMAIYVTCGGATESEIPHSNDAVALNSCRQLRSSLNIAGLATCPIQTAASTILPFIEKNVADIIFVSKAIAKEPNLVSYMAQQTSETIFNPARDSVSLDELLP